MNHHIFGFDGNLLTNVLITTVAENALQAMLDTGLAFDEAIVITDQPDTFKAEAADCIVTGPDNLIDHWPVKVTCVASMEELNANLAARNCPKFKGAA